MFSVGMGVIWVVLSGCAQESNLFLAPTPEDSDTNGESDDATVTDTGNDLSDTGTGDTDTDDTQIVDTGTSDTAVEGDDPASDCHLGSFDWTPRAFDAPADSLQCAGDKFIRFDAEYGLWIGVQTCTDGGEYRIYLASQESGPYLHALDWAGHGQDHCELVSAAFTLPNEDDITSGGCATCATSYNLSVPGVAAYHRGNLGTAWEHTATSATSDMTSRLRCGVSFDTCDEAPPPSQTFACAAGATVQVRHPIPAGDMLWGASSNTGDGACQGEVTFPADLSATSPWNQFHHRLDGSSYQDPTAHYNGMTTRSSCGSSHCADLYYGDGSVHPDYCTVVAYCGTDGVGWTVGFTW